VAIAEMALAGALGAVLDPRRWGEIDLTAFLFGEDQARYVVTTDNSDPVLRTLAAAGVPHIFLGSVGGSVLEWPNGRVAVELLRRQHERFFPELMDASAAAAL
jgi:phosphoribosylformylglycinamidine synthase